MSKDNKLKIDFCLAEAMIKRNLSEICVTDPAGEEVIKEVIATRGKGSFEGVIACQRTSNFISMERFPRNDKKRKYRILKLDKETYLKEKAIAESTPYTDIDMLIDIMREKKEYSISVYSKNLIDTLYIKSGRKYQSVYNYYQRISQMLMNSGKFNRQTNSVPNYHVIYTLKEEYRSKD